MTIMSWGEMNRDQRAAAVASMKSQGMSLEAISEKTGIRPSTVYGYLSDPTGERLRERKRRYSGECERCGSPTSGSGGRAAAPRVCRECARSERVENRYWTDERILAGLRLYAEDHGRTPVATDLVRSGGRATGYPPLSLVIRTFGSFANGMELAGFQRPRVGWKRNTESVDDLIALVRSASSKGVAPPVQDLQRVYKALGRRGVSWDEACSKAGVQTRRRARKEASASD